MPATPPPNAVVAPIGCQQRKIFCAAVARVFKEKAVFNMCAQISKPCVHARHKIVPRFLFKISASGIPRTPDKKKRNGIARRKQRIVTTQRYAFKFMKCLARLLVGERIWFSSLVSCKIAQRIFQ